nr:MULTISPECIES: SusC/RagA family TonB-linked outer membrane protein [Butyricimonas]
MRILMILLLIGSLHLSASSFSQTRVSLKMKDVTVQEVFSNLEKMTDYTFLYKLDLVGKCGKVNVEATNKDFSLLLEDLLKPLGLSFKIDDKVVVITVAQAKDEKKMITIKGRAFTADSSGVAGATVILKGTTTGVITNMAGEFTLTIPEMKEPVLIFSFMGMKTREVKYTGQKMMMVLMEEDTKAMDEVVVTGYQSVNRRDMVGAYTTVKASDIIMPAYNSIDQMLQGRVAGMIVMNTSSRVGTNPKIKIRGTSTLVGNQSPLWVVDGIIQEDPLDLKTTDLFTQDFKDIIGNQISWLNPMDIETITVLKDASATAVYGSKASNGVIVITTKKGKIDHLTINYTGNMSINTKPNYGMFNYMNSKERTIFAQDVFNAGTPYLREPIKQPYTYEGVMRMYLEGDISYEDFMQKKHYFETVNTDWFDLLTQTAVSHNHNLSVSGGTEKMTYNVSLGYSNSEGQEIGNSSERMTGRVGVGVNLHKNVRVDASISGSTTTNKSFGKDVNPMSYATKMNRAVPAYDENGDPVFYKVARGYAYSDISSLSYNFINERDNSGVRVEDTHLAANLNFRWDILNWLKYEFTGGYTRVQNNNETWSLEKTFYIASEYRGYDYGTVEPDSPEFKSAMLPFGGILVTMDGLASSYNIQNKLLISKTFNEDHRLNVMLGMELRSSFSKSNENRVFGYVPDRGEGSVKPTTPSEFDPIKGTFQDWGVLGGLYSGDWKRVKNTDNFLSYFATFAYSLKNRYVFNFSVRNDESNRFGQDANNRFDPTYSFGLSWRVTDEKWMESVSGLVDELNLRVTYGIQGNAATKLGPDLILQQHGIANVYKQYYSTISRLPNPNLSWERTKSWNFGLDMQLIKIFNVALDYYSRSSNAIVGQDIPFEYGMSSMDINGGKIRNSGVEFTVSFSPVQTKDWALSVSLNSSKNWNKAGKEQYVATRGDFLNGNASKILKKGYSVTGFWSYSFAGLSAEDGHPLFNLVDIPEEKRDSKIDPTTFLVYSGDLEPSFTGGLSLGLRWKDFSLSTGFSLLLGSKKRLPSPYAGFPNGGLHVPEILDNLSKDLNKRWKKPGDENRTHIPGVVISGQPSEQILPDNGTQSYISMWEQSDDMVVDASFLRCNQLSLSWSVNRDWCKKMGLKTLNVNAGVSNLFVIASKRFNGFDPELGNSVQPKNYSLGVSIGF